VPSALLRAANAVPDRTPPVGVAAARLLAPRGPLWSLSARMAMRRPRTLALGTWLAARGAPAAVGMALAAVGALGSVVLAVTLGRTDSAAAAELPFVESSAIAWTAGLTLALASSARAIARDREQGVLALVRSRGASRGAYVRGRVGGLVGVLATAVGGATLVGGIAATSVAHPALPAARAGLAAVVYAVAFAGTLGPVAMAALGARTRMGGYLALLAVLVLPELLSSWTGAVLPRGWHELTSIPAALAAVREGVAAPAVAGIPMVARALAGLAAVVALSLVVVAARAGGSVDERAS
jgi:hypothetical protein